MDTYVPHRRRVWLYGLGIFILFFLLAPCLVVVPMSFSDSQYLEFPPKVWGTRWYSTYFASDEWLHATWNSFRLAIATVVIATPMGVACAYVLHSDATGRLGRLRPFLMMPMVIPSVLIAIGLYLLYVLLGLNNTFSGLIIADVALALPFVIIAVTSGLESYDMNQERVARSLGASRLKAFLTVTAPQIRASIISGAIFAFVTAFDEAVIAIFLSGGETETLTRRMFQNIRDQIDPAIAAISTMLMGMSLLVLLLNPSTRAGRNSARTTQ